VEDGAEHFVIDDNEAIELENGAAGLEFLELGHMIWLFRAHGGFFLLTLWFLPPYSVVSSSLFCALSYRETPASTSGRGTPTHSGIKLQPGLAFILYMNMEWRKRLIQALALPTS